jgi:hypothetical protein
VQVDPVEPKLKPPGTKHLKLNCDILLSNSAFKFHLCRYSEVVDDGGHPMSTLGPRPGTFGAFGTYGTFGNGTSPNGSEAAAAWAAAEAAAAAAGAYTRSRYSST